MAAKVENVRENSLYMSILSKSILNNITTYLTHTHCLETDDVITTKRNKRLQNGDLSIRIRKKKSLEVSGSWHLNDINRTVYITATDKGEISEIKQEVNGTFSVKLKRGQVFPIVLRDVLKLKAYFGQSAANSDFSALVNVEYLHCHGDDFSDASSLSHLRSLLLSQHVQALLDFNGYNCENVQYKTLPKPFEELSTLFGFQLSQLKSTQIFQQMEDRLDVNLTNSQYRTNILEKPHRMAKSLGLDKAPVLSTRGLECRRLIDEQNLAKNNNGYDANIDVIDFAAETDRFKQLCVLEYNLSSKKTSNCKLCVHVSSYDHSFSQQVVDLGWKALSSQASDLQQIHVQCGAIALRKSCNMKELPSADELFRFRRKQMEDSFIMKYGNQIQGGEWLATIDELTKAAIRFEFLTTNSRSPLKLDFSENSGDAVIDKGGVFVMYNSARLATLFKGFDEAVEKKTYPPLPPMNEIDFSCLREEEEWELLWNYILTFPSLVRSCVAPLEENKPLSPIPTHKVCQFLLDLSRDFSSYYNRIHILGEPRQHLMETMQARLYLMKGVQQVMHNALALLDIKPVSQL